LSMQWFLVFISWGTSFLKVSLASRLIFDFSRARSQVHRGCHRSNHPPFDRPDTQLEDPKFSNEQWQALIALQVNFCPRMPRRLSGLPAHARVW
jgi:hypothetical protein